MKAIDRLQAAEALQVPGVAVSAPGHLAPSVSRVRGVSCAACMQRNGDAVPVEDDDEREARRRIGTVLREK